MEALIILWSHGLARDRRLKPIEDNTRASSGLNLPGRPTRAIMERARHPVMTTTSLRWDIFAKVVDNFGDAGVSWRLARQLAAEHQLDVTLWLDELAPLARLAPEVIDDKPMQRTHGVTIRRWDDPFPVVDVADVVIEAFGCGLPAVYLAAMAARASPPSWFVLEYLSAEPWVEGAHGLDSQHPQLSLARRFWFPGFTPRTGGLLRERGIVAARDSLRSNLKKQSVGWASLGVPMPKPDETRISLFCYPNPALSELLDAWADGDAPVVCIVPAGIATGALDLWTGGAVPHAGGPPLTRGRLALYVIPFVSQDDYDKLLWTCDINFVRGEDSFVRAQWAARPFIWHLYPQTERAHLTKLEAFMDLYAAGLDPVAAAAVRRLSSAWNAAPGAGPIGPAWMEFAAGCPKVEKYGPQWARYLSGLPDLAGGLVTAVQTRL